VSSAGLRKPCNEIYPAPAFLKMCADAGVLATVSSDAHAPDEVAWGYADVVTALREAGYVSVVYYRDREPVEVELS
jgi:histidinol-phosphatase (PHP family)